MSRIGKQPITIPKGVLIKRDSDTLLIKGEKGDTSLIIPSVVTLQHENDIITVSVKNPHDSEQRALWGTIQRLIENHVKGVTVGFIKRFVNPTVTPLTWFSMSRCMVPHKALCSESWGFLTETVIISFSCCRVTTEGIISEVSPFSPLMRSVSESRLIKTPFGMVIGC